MHSELTNNNRPRSEISAGVIVTKRVLEFLLLWTHELAGDNTWMGMAYLTLLAAHCAVCSYPIPGVVVGAIFRWALRSPSILVHGPAMRKEGIKGGKIDTSVSRFSQRFPFLHSLRRRHFVAARYRTNLRSAPPHIPSFFVVAPFGIGLFLKYPFPVSNWKTKKLGIRHIPAEKSAQQSLLIPTSLKLLPPGVPMNN